MGTRSMRSMIVSLLFFALQEEDQLPLGVYVRDFFVGTGSMRSMNASLLFCALQEEDQLPLGTCVREVLVGTGPGATAAAAARPSGLVCPAS